jgi:hypothetical protein
MTRPEKYRGADAVILRHPEKGILRLDPARFTDAARKDATKAGWVETPPQPDGFRKPRKRAKGEMARLIKEGVVADPAVGGQPHQEYGPDTFVFDLPLGQVGAEGKPAE